MKRYYEGNDGETVEDPEGWYVMFDEAQAEIDSRDKRISELEAQLASERHLLVRYMAIVIDAEGESYISDCQGYVVGPTEEEKARLRAVEPLAIAEMNK